MSLQTTNPQELLAAEQRKVKMLEKKLDRLQAEANQAAQLAKQLAAEQAERIDLLELESEEQKSSLLNLQTAWDATDRPVLTKEEQVDKKMLNTRIMDVEKENERLEESSREALKELNELMAHVDDHAGGVDQAHRRNLAQAFTAMVMGDERTRGKLMARRQQAKRKASQIEGELGSISKVRKVEEPQSSTSQTPPPPQSGPVLYHNIGRVNTPLEEAAEQSRRDFTVVPMKNAAPATQGSQQAQSLATKNIFAPLAEDDGSAAQPKKSRGSRKSSSSVPDVNQQTEKRDQKAGSAGRPSKDSKAQKAAESPKVPKMPSQSPAPALAQRSLSPFGSPYDIPSVSPFANLAPAQGSGRSKFRFGSTAPPQGLVQSALASGSTAPAQALVGGSIQASAVQDFQLHPKGEASTQPKPSPNPAAASFVPGPKSMAQVAAERPKQVEKPVEADGFFMMIAANKTLDPVVKSAPTDATKMGGSSVGLLVEPGKQKLEAKKGEDWSRSDDDGWVASDSDLTFIRSSQGRQTSPKVPASTSSAPGTGDLDPAAEKKLPPHKTVSSTGKRNDLSGPKEENKSSRKTFKDKLDLKGDLEGWVLRDPNLQDHNVRGNVAAEAQPEDGENMKGVKLQGSEPVTAAGSQAQSDESLGGTPLQKGTEISPEPAGALNAEVPTGSTAEQGRPGEEAAEKPEDAAAEKEAIASPSQESDAESTAGPTAEQGSSVDEVEKQPESGTVEEDTAAPQDQGEEGQAAAGPTAEQSGPGDVVEEKPGVETAEKGTTAPPSQGGEDPAADPANAETAPSTPASPGPSIPPKDVYKGKKPFKTETKYAASKRMTRQRKKEERDREGGEEEEG